ncbi:MAG: hypothetical protein HGA44_08805 [Cellulomonadaceae bacterium]|nr:hypothetical protein [Cellulomonadaceae bacterium]
MQSTDLTPAPPYNGYALTKVRTAGGDETLRFEAVLVRDGRPVAHVSNGGEGGPHRWSPVDAGGWSAIDRFNGYARAWNAGSELAGIEDGDQLINRLLEVAQMNRLRVLPFLLDGADFWTTGEYAVLRGATHDQVLEALRSPVYAHRRPQVWSRMYGDFIPVV